VSEIRERLFQFSSNHIAARRDGVRYRGHLQAEPAAELAILKTKRSR
jgi:hypothetical protein